MAGWLGRAANQVVVDDPARRQAVREAFKACNAAPAGYSAPNDVGYQPSSAIPCTSVVSNVQEGIGPGLRQTYLRDFDPRISFAYRPFANDHTVVRGGIGIFTVTALGQPA